ncbi:MAG: 50S ribosomal protein L23 [Desulfatibacillaceae bacterium]|nr:50S ribosomal protein L23 [Desulfatibacillaceae bacterium]
MNAHQIILRPLVTEKSTLQKEDSNQLSFEVAKTANKVEIARAVESLFKVKVDDVRTMRVTGKNKRRGRVLGKRRDWKKAIVRLAPGARIEFFEGV